MSLYAPPLRVPVDATRIYCRLVRLIDAGSRDDMQRIYRKGARCRIVLRVQHDWAYRVPEMTTTEERR